jgi:hypothetical protein
LIQNPPRDERSQLRSIADLERRIRTLETATRPFVHDLTAFATAADRTTVLTAPAEGDLSYQADTDTYYLYTGAVWVAVSSAAAVALTVAAAASWQAFTPTWSGSVTNPVIGNGTFDGKYLQVGKTVQFHLVVTMGSTTTYGSGAWGLTLPVAPLTSHAVPAVYVDSSASTRCSGSGWLTNGSGIFRMLPPTDAASSGISPTVPFTWATSDQIIISGTYETS